MSYIVVHNCNTRRTFRLQLARSRSSRSNQNWLDFSRLIEPGGQTDFQPPQPAGAIRLVDNQTNTTGTYVFSNQFHFDDIFFRPTGLVTTGGCQGGMNQLVALTINNCLAQSLVLTIQIRSGGMRSTELGVPPLGGGSLVVYLPQGALIGFRGDGAPQDTHQVGDDTESIYINSQGIGTSGCIAGSFMAQNGISIFTVGNCFASSAFLQIFNRGEAQWEDVNISNEMMSITVPTQGTALVPAPSTGQGQALYRLQLQRSNQSTVNTISFIYTNDRPPSQIWFNPDNPLVSSVSTCQNSIVPLTGIQNSIQVFQIVNCSQLPANLQVEISGGRFSTTGLIIPAEQNRPLLISALVGTTLQFTNDQGVIGSEFSVSAQGQFTLFIGSQEVGTDRSSICRNQQTGIFEAFNCSTSPVETCQQNNANNARWVVQQRIDGNWENISCIPSGGDTGVQVLPQVSGGMNGQNMTVSSISAAAFRVFSTNNDRTAPYLYTSDFPPSSVYFGVNRNASNICGGQGGTIQNLDVTNCTDEPFNIEIVSAGNAVNLGLTVAAQSRISLSAAISSQLVFSSSAGTYTHEVDNQDTTIFLGAERLSFSSCNDANSQDDPDENQKGAVESNPWVLILILAIGFIIVLIIIWLLYRSYANTPKLEEEPLPRTVITTGATMAPVSALPVGSSLSARVVAPGSEFDVGPNIPSTGTAAVRPGPTTDVLRSSDIIRLRPSPSVTSSIGSSAYSPSPLSVSSPMSPLDSEY